MSVYEYRIAERRGLGDTFSQAPHTRRGDDYESAVRALSAIKGRNKDSVWTRGLECRIERRLVGDWEPVEEET